MVKSLDVKNIYIDTLIFQPTIRVQEVTWALFIKLYGLLLLTLIPITTIIEIGFMLLVWDKSITFSFVSRIIEIAINALIVNSLMMLLIALGVYMTSLFVCKIPYEAAECIKPVILCYAPFALLLTTVSGLLPRAGLYVGIVVFIASVWMTWKKTIE